MNANIRIVGQIAAIFGVIFVVFAVFAAFVNYNGITAQYGGVSIEMLQYSLLAAMIPYLLYAALSFAVAGVIMRSTREPAAPEQTAPMETKPQEMAPETERDEPVP